jgi:hypothetical protein
MNLYIRIALLLAFKPISGVGQAIHNNGATIVIVKGATVNVNGNLSNQSGELKNNGQLNVNGNIANNQVFSSHTAGSLTIAGSTAQTISGNSPLWAKNVTINNAAGITLANALNIDGTLTLSSGIINALTAPVILTADAVVTGVSDASHVNGYIRKMGTGTFTFPVGDGNRYQPVDLDIVSNTAGVNVRYFGANAGASSFTTDGSSSIPLEAYNNQEYWDITPEGTASGAVTLFWDNYKNPSITSSTNINVFKVAHKTTLGWRNEGSALVTGTTTAGSVSSGLLSSWSPFTLGVINENTLPVILISFTARQIEGKAQLEWKTTSEINASHFDVERSIDARSFEKIGTVNAQGNSQVVKDYSFSDNQFTDLAKLVYYRLRSVDSDGSFSLSSIVSLRTSSHPAHLSVYPNPALQHIPVTLEATRTIKELKLFNSSGILLPLSVKNIENGKAHINTSQLVPGNYVLQIGTDMGVINQKLVIN